MYSIAYMKKVIGVIDNQYFYYITYGLILVYVINKTPNKNDDKGIDKNADVTKGS